MVVNRRDDMKSFEFVDVDVFLSSGNSMKFVIIYRPPPSKKEQTLTFLFNLLLSSNTPTYIDGHTTDLILTPLLLSDPF